MAGSSKTYLIADRWPCGVLYPYTGFAVVVVVVVIVELFDCACTFANPDECS